MHPIIIYPAGVDSDREATFKVIMEKCHTNKGYTEEKMKRSEEEWPFHDRTEAMRGYVYQNSTERQLGKSSFIDDGLQILYAAADAKREIAMEEGKDWVRYCSERVYKHFVMRGRNLV